MKRKQFNVTEELHDKIMIECKQEFLRTHPDFKGINITQEFMLLRLAKYYLEEKQ